MYQLSEEEQKKYNETHDKGIPCQPSQIPCEIWLKIIVHALQEGFRDEARKEQARWN